MEKNNIQEATRLRQVKKHLFDNRKTLSEEEFKEYIDKLASEVYAFGFNAGWQQRNLIDRICSTARRIRMRSEFDEMYTKHMQAISNVDKTKPFTLNQLTLIEDMIRDWL